MNVNKQPGPSLGYRATGDPTTNRVLQTHHSRSRTTRRVRRDIQGFAFGVAMSVQMSLNTPVASADDLVTYEVDSTLIKVANIEYEDVTGRVALQNTPLPWRTDAKVRAVRAAPPTGSQVRADWRPTRGMQKWVSVRIIYQGKLLCQNTLDIGDAACYGITPRIT
ncbi:hypothetical protein MINTM008_01580 [Mycobacterium intracellulare]|nr:hypothetical protein L843_0225 [Mycobacterium intracellulare MIN_061107_1834]BCO60206.1 hypothetical protein MINTM006_01560 [Mycobacterium intracellulare]BCO70823.1 hypothetical protein MINTM008_01580 [Mycobacterium intracellulare]BCO76375.1 hypothetical protein MINTM009_01570 [Mycobacterium intracellulare]BCP18368.1 hypothetical protein MINTM023_01570 [Mycobacterium intracellulare]